MSAKFFRSAEELREWFARNHATATELLVGFYKKVSGKPSITWSESVDEALCVGWIDGVRKSLDEDRYTIRFTPRRPGSVWSAANVKRVAELRRQGRMQPAGLAAFARRKANKSGIYSYEKRPQSLPEPYVSTFRKNTRAWAFFESQPPGYRRTATWWVISAKKEETREKRLASLIADAEAGRTIRQFIQESVAKKGR
jgi:uncharacterized protein YdeI (YjbR/CyaY-like superfamily)